MTTVFLVELYGQTSNNFFQHVFFDSFCRENNIKFVNPWLRKYYGDYPNLNEYKRSKLIDYLTLKLLKKGLRKGWIKVEEFDDISKSHAYYDRMKRPGYICCKGWFFRDNKLVEKYRSVYQHLFAPDIDHGDLEKKYLARHREEQIIIGVHIRRGDYKEWRDGIYYFDDNVYVNKINELLNVLGKDCKIIIFTNDEAFDVNLYKEQFRYILLSDNSVKTDHYLMSKCDYIIGPPSTFSMWAGYIGNVPYYHIKDPKTALTLDGFLNSDWAEVF